MKGKVFLTTCPENVNDSHDHTAPIALVIYSYEIKHMWIMRKKSTNKIQQKSKVMHLDELSQHCMEKIKLEVKMQGLFQSIPNVSL